MRGLHDGLAPDRVRHHRTIFISDVHLGTPGCKAELLADFLTHNDCRTLYLVSDIVNLARRGLGLPHWSLSAFLKHKVKNAASFIADFEHAVARAAQLRGADGVVCGHIHNAQIKTIDGVLYCNDGDWVESCTALIEDARGRLEIVEWTSFAYERDQDAQKGRRKALIHAPRQPVAA